MVPALFDYSEPWSASVVDKGEPPDVPGSDAKFFVGGGGAEIFPLPTSCLERVPGDNFGRRSAQRVSRRRFISHYSNEVCNSLNFLSGVESDRDVRFSSAREAVMSRIRNRVSALRPPPEVEHGDAALRRLLGSKASLYQSDEGPTCAAGFDSELLSLPLHGGACNLAYCPNEKEKLDLLDPDAGLLLSDSEVACRVRDEGRANVFWDPKLGNGGSVYDEFLTNVRRRLFG